MTRTLVLLAIGVAGSLGACGKSDKKDGGTSTSSAGKPEVTIDVAAVNALVPPALKDRLVFDKRDLVIERGKHKTTYTIAAPRNWPQDSKRFAHMKPDDKAGFVARFEIGSNCDGECSPKPWEAIADRVNFAPRAQGHVQKDDRAPGRRTMIAQVDGNGATKTEVVVAWWIDGDKSYHTCTASLDEALQDAAPAFEKACQAVAIDGDD
jgi:hypothetical protein